MSDYKIFTFDFGPVSRTLGKNKDSVAFAPLPLHEALVAFLGAQNRDEFIAWLWHDTFKSLFNFEITSRGDLVWQHYPIHGLPDPAGFDGAIRRMAYASGISSDYVFAHQRKASVKRRHFPRAVSMLPESDTINNEFEQLSLGTRAQFVQISFCCLPSASTALLRLVVMEAFLQELSEIIAREIENLHLPFSSVDYVFRREDRPLNEAAVTAQYDLSVNDKVMTITHFVPSPNFLEQTITVDLTAAPPDRERPQRLALPELLTIYSDDLTLIAGLPLFSTSSPSGIVSQIQNDLPDRVLDLLNALNISPSHKWATNDLIAYILAEQIEIRALLQNTDKIVNKLIARPRELLTQKHLASRCVCCGSPIIGGVGRYLRPDKTSLEDIFSGRFTDFEHVGLEKDVCPMCMIYANYENKQMMRGSLALLAPSTSLHAPSAHTFERPRFDNAGRFDPINNRMVKSAITLQELVLLSMLSRRIIDWIVPFAERITPKVADLRMSKQKSDKTIVDTVVGKHLLYSGAYLLFDIAAINFLYRNVFLDATQMKTTYPGLWQSVRLIAYPFEIDLSPAFTMLLELRVSDDFMNHAGSHTLLRLTPTTVYLSPEFSCNVLVDNSLQEAVNRSYAKSLHLIGNLAATPGIERHQYTAAILTGQDPITAAYEAAELPRKSKGDKGKKKDKKKFDHRTAAARRVFEEQVSADSLEEMWARYQKLSVTTAEAAENHPTLIHFVPKPKKKGG